MEDFLTGVSVVLGVIVILLALVFIKAIVVYFLWGWVMVPLGLPQINLIHSFLLSLLVSVLTYQTSSNNK